MMKLTGMGKYAFTVVPKGAPGTVYTEGVLSAAVDHPLGVPWGITLAAWGGNQSIGRNVVHMPSLQARITWSGGGVGGTGQEIALVDYPASGTTLHVHATNVMVEMLGVMPSAVDAGTPPTLSGWLSKANMSQRPMTATLTNDVRVVADGFGFIEQVPPRARAYRLFFLSGTHIDGTQLSAESSPVTLSLDHVMDSAVSPADYFGPAARANWFPLSPRCQQLVVNNVSGGGVVGQWAVQWLLELG